MNHLDPFALLVTNFMKGETIFRSSHGHELDLWYALIALCSGRHSGQRWQVTQEVALK